MPEHDDLLKRFQPVLRYDSNEQFFADSAEQYMVNPGNELRRKRTETGNGAVLASAQPKGDEPLLTLEFLGPKTYGDGSPVQEGDVIGVNGQELPRAVPRPAHRASRSSTTSPTRHAIEANGRLWLQYWLWYFYNDYQLSFALGTHEGDWEMVQFRMDDDAGHPDIAVYAQHRYGEVRPWEEVEKFAPDPCGRSSTSRAARTRRTSRPAFTRPRRGTTSPTASGGCQDRPKLEILGTEEPAWTRWPGRWGDTLPREKTLESNSPTGPGAKKQWRDPDTMLDNPSTPKHGKAPAPPDVQALRRGRRAARRVRRLEAQAAPAHARRDGQLAGRGGRPPQTHNIAVHPSGHGKVTTKIVLDPLKRYDVSTSTIAGDPPIAVGVDASPRSRRSRKPKLTAQQRVLAFISGAGRGRARRPPAPAALTRRRAVSRRRGALRLDLLAHEAARDVVVDDARRLHQRVGGRRADEAKAAALELARERLGLGGRGRHVGERRAAAARAARRRERPQQVGQRLAGLVQRDGRARVGDRRLDLRRGGG